MTDYSELRKTLQDYLPWHGARLLFLRWSFKTGLFLHQVRPIAIQKNMVVEPKVCSV